MLHIVYAAKAQKQLLAITSIVAARIRQKIAAYAAHPASLANQVIRLKGSGLLRMRVGDYRVIFTEDGIVLTVAEVGHRREIYE